MNIETSLASIAKSLEMLVTRLGMPIQSMVMPASPTPAVMVEPIPATVSAEPVPVPPAAVMPAVPQVPVPPATPSPQHATAPFSDAKGLMEYGMAKYRQLGPVKGGLIQSVLLEMGHSNINALRPDQYAEFHHKVESIV